MIGIRKSAGYHSPRDTLVFGVEQLPQLLPRADHVVLLRSGNEDTDGFMSPEQLLACKPGAILYNFGRGNALRSKDLLDHWHRLRGSFLDATEEEPLPAESPLVDPLPLSVFCSSLLRPKAEFAHAMVIDHRTG